MKWLAAFLSVLILSGCVATGEMLLSPAERARCIKDAEGYDIILPRGWSTDCQEYGERRIVKGVWYNGFEESGFIEGVRTVPLTRDLEDRSDRSFDAHLDVPRGRIYRSMGSPPIRDGCTMAIYVEFLGRKAIRRIPAPIEGEEPHFKVERVLKSQYLGRVSSYHRGELDRDCPN